MFNKEWRVLLLVLVLVFSLTDRNCCEAKRTVLRKIFSFLDFDARTVSLPSAIAPRVPTILVPQYKSPNPIEMIPHTKFYPHVMVNGITPYSSLPNPHVLPLGGGHQQPKIPLFVQ